MSSRPRWPLYGLIAALVLGFSAWMWLRPSPNGTPTPIVLISVDTLRADHLPIYGYTKVKTPAIDALARDGIVFDRAYAHSPQTLPSHTAILTGQLPFETGVRDNVGFTLRGDQPTLAQFLHDDGFTTGGVASAFVLRKETGIARGFDFYDAELPPSAPDTPMGEVQRPGPESLAVAERWVGGLRSPRFFLFFHIYEPHAPYTPPARYADYAPYDGEVAFSDEIVGRLVTFLKDKGLYERALIVFLSDHGEGLGEHGEQEHGLFLYDETIRVPLVIKLPGSRGAGRRVDQPVQHLDLVPTVLDLAGLRVPPNLRGRTLRPALDRADGRLPEPGFYSESYYSRFHFGWSELVALTDARYRFIKAPRPELYDLLEDSHQQRNLAAERESTAAAMRAGLAAMTKGAVTQAPQRVSREDLERLQALGYVGTQPADASAPADSLPDPKDKAGVLVAYRAALQASARRDYDGAISLLESVVRDNPAMKDGWQQLGIELVKAGRREEALAPLKRVVELDPGDANAIVTVASALAALGRYREASDNAMLALAKTPASNRRTTTSACEVLVTAALAEKDVAAARRFGKLAEASDPSFPLATYVEARVLHDAGKFTEALPVFEEAVRRLQRSSLAIPQLYYYLGDTLGNLGREQEAVGAFEQEIRYFPQSLDARSHLAALYRAAGKNAEAERAVADMLRTTPTPEGYATAERVWKIVGEPGRAEAVKAEAARRFGKQQQR